MWKDHSDEIIINKSLELLEKAAELLNEVRTGSDFECECWECAEKIEEWLHGK